MLRSILVIALGSTVVACTVDKEVPIQVVVEASGAAFVEIHPLTAGCPSTPDDLSGEALRLTPGTGAITLDDDVVALAGVGIDTSCRVVAFGCAALEGTEPVELALTSFGPGQGCDAGSICGADGRCSSAMADLGRLDLGPFDLGTDLGATCAELELLEPEGDEDSDGRSNSEECVCGADMGCEGFCLEPLACEQVDTDFDGMPDYRDRVQEVGDGDRDEDGLPDAWECCGDDLCTEVDLPCRDSDGDGTPDIIDTDSDGDGATDQYECSAVDCRVDSDGDGFLDVLDMDSDDDGALDGMEPETRRSDSALDCLTLVPDRCGMCEVCGELYTCADTPVATQCTPRPDWQVTTDADSIPFGTSGIYLAAWEPGESRLLDVPPLVDLAGILDGSTRTIRVDGTLLPPVDVLSRLDASCQVGACVWLAELVVAVDTGMSGLAIQAQAEESLPLYMVGANVNLDESQVMSLFPELVAEGLAGPLRRGWNRMAAGETIIPLVTCPFGGC